MESGVAMKSSLQRLGVLLLLSPVCVAAEAADCPPPAKLPAVCMAISNAQKDTSGKYQFHYQKLVYEAACSSPSEDDEQTGNAKIRQMWSDNTDRLVCNNASFSVIRGNVLKYAASNRFDDFLFDAAMVWKVDLNTVDPSDGRTVLDYVQDEVKRHHGKAIEKSLRSYYDMLRSSGAKHRSELSEGR